MAQRRRTRAEAEIEAQLSRLEPGSDRYDMLAAVRDFKASWVQLGERLTVVREKRSFQDWGYGTFETYCRRELRLKSDTANKLTRSFSFLRDHEPRVLEEQQEREVPPLDVVDLLSQARERASVSSNDMEAIRREVFDAEHPPTRNQVVKRFREVDPEAFKSAPRAQSAATNADLRKALLLAERLESILEMLPDVTQGALDSAHRVAKELKRKFEAEKDKEPAKV